MTLLRVFRANRLSYLSSCSKITGQKTHFSTSGRMNLRQRPLRRATSRISNQAHEDSQATSPVTVTPNLSSNVKAEAPRSQSSAQETVVPGFSLHESTSKPRKAKPRGPLPKGIKPYQQVLMESESICFKQGSTSPVDVPKEDKPALAAAGKFFEERYQILYSAENLHDHPQNDHIPEIVVLGASNAGKSSFLNALLGDREIAKVSHKPGKTTTMNAYGVGPRPKIAKELIRKGDAPPKHSLVLMDTPGYGYRSQQAWGQTILKYLNVRNMLRGAVILIPADKKLQETDRWMLRTLAQSNTRTLVVITKADKPGKEWQDACHRLHTQIEAIMRGLEAQSAVSWREGSGRVLDVYATASKIASVSRRLGDGGGIGGVRLAILEMAGFSLGDKIEKQAETKAYTGKVVSFDDIVWRS
ncbi:gtp-binding engb [Fusarium pseudoanthophilum]|uniref:Gtp-binding engb n=1 Tax=Fusarium pseudoanthophilum TaxID=48495 RepID=A0A8H5KB72_9HYPO|nr:gtp-binding engb [Fusarium pseudoanthophilum]